jgi:small subunit ribosomal protein S20
MLNNWISNLAFEICHLAFICMPVTKTAKRALRASERKAEVNKRTLSTLDMAMRKAKRDKKPKDIDTVFSLLDRSAKHNIIHKKKADRLKSRLVKKIAAA